MALFLCLAPSLAAQTDTGRINGTVTDTNGAAVASARVELMTSQQATIASTTTDAQGRFSFADVPRGACQNRGCSQPPDRPRAARRQR